MESIHFYNLIYYNKTYSDDHHKVGTKYKNFRYVSIFPSRWHTLISQMHDVFPWVNSLLPPTYSPTLDRTRVGRFLSQCRVSCVEKGQTNSTVISGRRSEKYLYCRSVIGPLRNSDPRIVT